MVQLDNFVYTLPETDEYCENCGVVNSSEIVEEGDNEIRVCMVCGDEVVESTRVVLSGINCTLGGQEAIYYIKG